MKRSFVLPIIILVLFCLVSCADKPNNELLPSSELNQNDLENSQIVMEPFGSTDSYYIPDYQTDNTLHSDEFLEILKRDGYHMMNGEIGNYNLDNIDSIVNITPPSISDETSDLEFFYVKDGNHCFLMANQKIYWYDTFGGYHLQLCLWDYDGNGTKDLVSYDTFGSGFSHLGVRVFDLTSMERIDVITRNITYFNTQAAFSFECKNGVIYIDGEELTYSDGSFRCNAFN